MPRTTGYVAAQARHASSVDVPVRPTAPQLIHLSSIGDNAVVLQHAWQPRRDETALDADVSVTYCTRRSVVRNVTRRSRGGPPPRGVGSSCLFASSRRHRLLHVSSML